MNKNIHMSFDNYEDRTYNLFEVRNHLTLICVWQTRSSGYTTKIVHYRSSYLKFKVISYSRLMTSEWLLNNSWLTVDWLVNE